MDFDEFAMWIMNSEFRPAIKSSKEEEEMNNTKKYSSQKQEDELKSKLKNIMQDYPLIFLNMKKKITYLEFIADISRVNLPLTEKEARLIFHYLDPNDKGQIESKLFKIWTESTKKHFDDYLRRKNRSRNNDNDDEKDSDKGGNLDSDSDSEDNIARAFKQKSLKEQLLLVIGRNTRQLENSFAHIRENNVFIPYEEFLRCVLNCGINCNKKLLRILFNNLSEETDRENNIRPDLSKNKKKLISITTFFNNLLPIIDDAGTVLTSNKQHNSILASRAERHLKESMRKSFKVVKNDLEKEDPNNTGYVTSDVLYKIILKRCIPLSYEDFRWILVNITKKNESDTVNYIHFLHFYNPIYMTHQLESKRTLNNTNKTDTLNSSSNNFDNSNIRDRPSTSIGEFTSLSTHNSLQLSRSISNSVLNSSANLSSTNNKKKNDLQNPELRKVWQQILRECHLFDPERSGLISSSNFLRVLDKIKTKSTSFISNLNDVQELMKEYKMSSGLINYHLLIKNFLHDLSQSGYALIKSPSSSNLNPLKPLKSIKSTDNLNSSQSFSASKSSNQPTEKDTLLSRLDNETKEICKKCYDTFLPQWRQLRTALKKEQNGRGTILATNFINIIENHGLSLTKKELGLLVKNFRGTGAEDAVKFDDFLKVCMYLRE